MARKTVTRFATADDYVIRCGCSPVIEGGLYPAGRTAEGVWFPLVTTRDEAFRIADEHARHEREAGRFCEPKVSQY